MYHESKYTLLTCPKYTTIQNTNNNLAVWRLEKKFSKQGDEGKGAHFLMPSVAGVDF